MKDLSFAHLHVVLNLYLFLLQSIKEGILKIVGNQTVLLMSDDHTIVWTKHAHFHIWMN